MPLLPSVYLKCVHTPLLHTRLLMRMTVTANQRPNVSTLITRHCTDYFIFKIVFSISLSPTHPTALPSPPSFHPSLLIEESVRGVDEALAKYDRDIHIMNHRPQRGGTVPTHKQSGMSEEEKYQMQVPCSHVSTIT